MKTVDQFHIETKLSVKTILKNVDSIKGAQKSEDGTITFIDGTRYPVNKSHVSVKSPLDKYYSILKATAENRYIDHEYLLVDETSFNLFLNELLENGYLQPKNNGNPYGANSYEYTMKTANLLSQSKYKALKELAGCLGAFSGAFYSQLNP